MEKPSNEVQDPAEEYRTDVAVETTVQPVEKAAQAEEAEESETNSEE